MAALLALALAPLTLAGTVVADPCVVRVDLDAGDDAEATGALQDAIDAADSCSEEPEHVVEVSGDVILTEPVVHRYAVPVVVRGVGAERSVLSGGGTHRILLVIDDTEPGVADLTLEHVELRDGYADERTGSMLDIEGGAVWVEVGADMVLTVRDSILADNAAVPDDVSLSAGGAIAADAVVLEDVAVVGNTAEYGGALAVGTLEARRVTFEDNGSIAATVCAAGGVSVCAADATMTTLEGGAVRAGLTVTLENVTFHDNRARIGGAVWMDASEPITDEGVGVAAAERGMDATFVTFVGNAATDGSHVAGVDTDGLEPVDVVPATFRASLFLDAVVLLDDIIVADGPEGRACLGLDVADGGAAGSVTDGSDCPGTTIDGTASTLLDGPADHGAVGRTFLPAASVVSAPDADSRAAGGAAPSAGVSLIDAVDGSVGTWPEEDQRGEERPQGEGCEVGAVELAVEEDDLDDEDDDVRDDDAEGDGGGPVPSAVPSGPDAGGRSRTVLIVPMASIVALTMVGAMRGSARPRRMRMTLGDTSPRTP